MKNTKCSIIMYHYVRNLKRSRYPNIKGLDEQLFVEQLDFLTKELNIINMELFIDSINGKAELPPKAALLTFDDGYIDHYHTVFPHLDNRGLQGSFFVPAEVVSKNIILDVNKIHFILASAETSIILNDIYKKLDSLREEGRLEETDDELKNRLARPSRFDNDDIMFIKSLLQHGLAEELRCEIASQLFNKYVSVDEEAFSSELYLTFEHIKLMKQCGMFFGLHGYKHYWLGKLKSDEITNEINKALNFWDKVIDCNNWVMNYPYGSYSNDVIEVISSSGCVLGLSTKVDIADISQDNRYMLPRLDTNDFPPKSMNYLKYGVVL